MANELTLSVKDAYEIADSFAQASSRILDFRIAHREALSPDESTRLEKYEDSLDSMVVLFRGYGIKLIGANAQEAADTLKGAIDAGKAALAEIEDIRKAIKVAAAVVDLAIGLISKSPKAVVTAVKGIKDAANPAPQEAAKA